MSFKQFVGSFVSSIKLSYLLVFAAGIMLFGHNTTLNIVSLIVITYVLLRNLEKEEFLFSYFGLIFFESILEIPFLEGTYFRVYQFLFLFRIFKDMSKKINFRISLTLETVCALTFLLLSIFYVTSLVEGFSMIINVFIVLYILNYFKRESKSQTISKIFVFISVFSALSGIYGFLFLNPIEYGYVSRFVGTMGDPNYSALFYTLGIFSTIGSNLISIRFKIVIFFVLTILLFATISLTGIIGSILLLILYMMFVQPKYGLITIFVIVLSLIMLMSFNFEYGTPLHGVKARVESILTLGDFNELTSGRVSIMSDYLSNFSELPLENIVFGGKNTVSGIYKDMMVKKIGDVSHSAYIDMIFMIGVLGSSVLIGFFILIILKNVQLYRETNDTSYLALAFTKLTILYYGLSISIFPFRYFYTTLLI